jgi:hypothetical protein
MVEQFLSARVFLLCEGQRGLRLRHLLFGLIDSRLPSLDLRVDIGDAS